jgi:3-deoxy-7-phosphoheptulonate synthase
MIENKAPGKDISAEDMASKFPLAARTEDKPKSQFEIAGVPFGGDLIPVMAGPNTVENRDMILRTAEAAQKAGAHFLRGGAFKPLSFPYRSDKYFELREEGLRYLQDARDATGLPIITEVMDQNYVKAVAEVADILQIGTRNMQNYALLIDCGRSGKPCMLKRHYGASLRDWLGAAEYLMLEGCTKLILCERGMSTPHTHRSSSRFLLDLQVIPAAQEVSHLPIGTDPSHATFWAPWVKPMSLASVAAGADFIMLEVHPDPRNAAVDPLQPIAFDEFDALMVDMERVARAVGRTVGRSLEA